MMETDCTRKCWATGAAGGLLVWLSVSFIGSAGWLQGLTMGLVTTGILGSLLVWGLCTGAGTAGDNEALLAGGWTDEPFTPSARVVGAGGETVPPQTLPDAARVPHSAPRDSRTVTPADGGQAAASRPAGADGGSAGARTGAPDRGRTRIVAGASPDAPIKGQASTADESATASGGRGKHGAADERHVGAVPRGAPTGDHRIDVALVEPAPGATGQVTRKGEDPVEGMILEEPELPGEGGEALTLASSGLAAPEADAEAGDEDKAPQGGIVPLAEGEQAAAAADGPAATSGHDGRDAVVDDATSAVAPRADAGGDEARPAADDLTRIRGIGPMLQNWLAGYGVHRVDQIAAWDDAEIARYAGMMGRMGHRIRGEDWVGQARLLAAGGQTAHGSGTDEAD